MSDPAKYRTKEEVQKMRTEKDPIESLKETLVSLGHIDEDALKAMDKQVRERINKAADFAQESAEPDPAELYTDILIEA